MRPGQREPTKEKPMKQQLYAVFDTCAGIYDSPHFSNSDDVVKRQFADIATVADNPISKHPEHYSLWRLANWDNQNGKVLNEANECLCTALEIISQSHMVDGLANQRALEAEINPIGPNGDEITT